MSAPGTEDYERARKRVEDLKGLMVHAVVYVVINTGLFAINALTRGDGGTWWFYWPLLGWGVGLLLHAVTFAVLESSTMQRWEDRKTAEYASNYVRESRQDRLVR